MTPAIACDLTALAAEERALRRELARKVFGAVVERRELDRGFAFRIDLTLASLAQAGEWIGLERRCCPFFDFRIDVGREGGAAWINITGGDGVKEFLRSELRG